MAKATAKQPFLPMFVGDFMAATAEWEGEEQALYALLLMHQWAIGDLPIEITKLARLCRWDIRAFERYWPVVSSKFTECCGRLVNIRLEEHREKSHALSEKNSAAGKKGAESRWHKDGERHQERMASATGVNGECHQSANGITHSNPSHPIPSHPIPEVLSGSSQDSSVCSPSKGREPTRAHAGNESHPKPGNGFSDEHEHAEWEAVQELYPPAPARADWIGAERAARQLVEDGLATWDEIRAGVTRYAALVKATNRMVLNPVRFFTERDRPWSQAWPLPAGKAAAPTMDEMRAKYGGAEVANG